MNNKTKTVVGISGVTIISIIVHLLHAAHLVGQLEDNNEPAFKSAKVTILIKDSVNNKMDTMDLGEYLKKQ